MRGKKGVSRHVEMMISFMLFVVFVMFLLIFVQPFESRALPDSVMAGLERNFIKNASVNLTRVFVSAGCEGIEKSEFMKTVWVREEESVRKLIGAGDSFYLLVSEDISNQGEYDFGDCDNFTIGSVERREIVSIKKLQLLKGRYESNYNDLRSELGVPPTIDFAVVVSDPTHNSLSGSEDLSRANRSPTPPSREGVEMTRFIPDEVNVIARTIVVPVLYEEGGIENLEVVFRIW